MASRATVWHGKKFIPNQASNRKSKIQNQKLSELSRIPLDDSLAYE